MRSSIDDTLRHARAHGLGLQSLAMDLGWALTLEIESDATAATGICRRRGLGKVRHISVADLWVHERLKSNDFKLITILGTENPADMMTNILPRPSLHKMIQLSGLDGRLVVPNLRLRLPTL